MKDELYHYGIKGQKWGVRRYQNPDGTLTPAGRERYGLKMSSMMSELSSLKYKEFDGLMSAKQVRDSKSGSCHDMVVYEANELRKMGYSPKAHFFIEASDDGQGGATHSICYFQDGGKTYWLEQAWEDQQGLRAYSSVKEMLEDVRNRWDKNPEYPNLYDGVWDLDSAVKGMSLQDIIDSIDFDERR